MTLIRHGETALNIQRRFRGRREAPLTARGKVQALAVAGRLSHLQPAAVYASPRQRAIATATSIAAAIGVDVIQDPRLDDLDYGSWTGITDEAAADRWPALHRSWLAHPESVTFPEGEAVADAVARIEDAVTDLRRRHPHDPIIAVTHDVVIRLLICRALDAPLSSIHRIRIDLASASCFEFPCDTATVVTINDTAHLTRRSDE